MPKPLSLDIRRRFQSLLADGVSGREAARRLMISAASASRRGQNLRPTHQRNREYRRPLHPRRMLELSRRGWIRSNINSKCFKE